MAMIRFAKRRPVGLPGGRTDQRVLAFARQFWPWLAAVVLLLVGIAVKGIPPSTWLPSGEVTVFASKHVPLPELFDELEERTFRFFWDTADSETGLVPDRYPTPSYASIAATGFGLTAYPIGVERGYITRAAARDRVLKTLRFLYNAPQGNQATGMAGYKGFYYRYLDMKTGARVGDIELSTVDTSLLLGGMLFCQSYFDRQDPTEVQIRNLVEAIYRRVDWRWAQVRPPAISHGWTPESLFLEYDWRGYNEAMLVYLLALGSPTHPVAPSAWEEWARGYAGFWDTEQGRKYLAFGSLFGHQYSHVWIDFRGILDTPMRQAGFDYAENTRRATYAQRAYAIANPMHWTGYGENIWGLTASDGATNAELPFAGEKRRFRTYWARGIGKKAFDDGTIAPTAAAASIAFAPEIALPAVMEMYRRYGAHIVGEYGFYDAFNPSFNYDVPLTHGRRIPDVGWVATDYLGIDEGPIVAMIENYRTGLVWRAMRKNPHIRRGLELAGFNGGWLEHTVAARWGIRRQTAPPE